MSFLRNLFRSSPPVAAVNATGAAETFMSSQQQGALPTEPGLNPAGEPGICQLSRDLTTKILIEVIVQSVKNVKRDYRDVIDSLAAICPFWQTIVKTAAFDDQVVERLKKEDPSYPCRQTIQCVPVVGEGLDADKIIAITVMQNKIYVVNADNKRTVKVFSVETLVELDNKYFTTPGGISIKAVPVASTSLVIEFSPDIYWLGSCDALHLLYIALDASRGPPIKYHSPPNNYREQYHTHIVLKDVLDNYRVVLSVRYQGIYVPQITVSPRNGHMFLADRYTMQLLELAAPSGVPVHQINLWTNIRYPIRSAFFRNKLAYFMPLDYHHCYLLGHQHPTSNQQRFYPVAKKNSSFRLSKIRFDPTDETLMKQEIPVELVNHYHKHCATRVIVINVTEAGDIIVLLSRSGRRESVIVQLDSKLAVQRYMGLVNWPSDLPGLCAVDHSQQRLYIVTNGKIMSAKAWRNYGYYAGRRPTLATAPLATVVSTGVAGAAVPTAAEDNAVGDEIAEQQVPESELAAVEEQLAAAAAAAAADDVVQDDEYDEGAGGIAEGQPATANGDVLSDDEYDEDDEEMAEEQQATASGDVLSDDEYDEDDEGTVVEQPATATGDVLSDDEHSEDDEGMAEEQPATATGEALSDDEHSEDDEGMAEEQPATGTGDGLADNEHIEDDEGPFNL